jgi:hypothetical protein
MKRRRSCERGNSSEWNDVGDMVLNWNFRFSTYDLRIVPCPCPPHNEFATGAGPSQISGGSTARFCQSDEPACCRRFDFSDTAPILFPRPQIFQLQSEYYPLGTGSVQIRRSIWPNSRRCRCPFGQQQPVVLGVLDQSPASLHEPLLQTRQRPGVDSLRQHESAPQVA